jgi:sugar phosphate isomerase/epimerase
MKKLTLLAAAVLSIAAATAQVSGQRSRGNLHQTPRIRIGLNYYSFNTPLTKGGETIGSVIDYAADLGFEGLDITGYYFPGYPAVPSDDYILKVKNHAFHQGMTISGTGVRNDFTLADPAARAREIQLVKDWVVVASKLGASTIRVFAGPKTPEGYTRDETAKWLAAAVDECAEFAKPYGVIIALQNHDDFLKTADDVEKIFALLTSDNVGLMLDVGCYHTDPYREIEQTIRYAVTWQIKENVFIDDVETPTDIPRIIDIIARNGYRGFVPIEILGAGNERERTRRMFEGVRDARTAAMSKIR